VEQRVRLTTTMTMTLTTMMIVVVEMGQILIVRLYYNGYVRRTRREAVASFACTTRRYWYRTTFGE
jgi:Tfp pilus assembly protein PilE